MSHILLYLYHVHVPGLIFIHTFIKHKPGLSEKNILDPCDFVYDR
uniref:Uncharacterized protein n=1 Tax=Timema poppense TaxID=170557 RepID=A0A7R9DVS7_TIMPO|nr:unnamed protein product [Timema poppensis]